MSTYHTLNPATGEELETFETLTDEQVEGLIDQAVQTSRTWRQVPLDERSQALTRIADLYEERAEELAQTITREMGKPITAARGEIKTVVGIYRYYAEQGPGFLKDEKIDVQGSGSAYIRREAIGVLLGIMPWNFPHYQVARFAAPNLLLGNVVTIKHAANCGASAQAIHQLMADAGLPEGAYTNLFATHDQVEGLIADDRIQGVSLTGSDGAGAKIGALAGKHVKKAVLELGGSDPFIVLEDADLDEASTGAVMGRLVNTGQTCTSSKRFIVVDSVYDAFVEQFVAKMADVQPADPTLEDTLVGPLSSARARDELHELVEDAVQNGATVLTGGGPVDGPGSFYQPTILSEVTEQARAYREELFGPVGVVYRVPDEEAAIRLANDSPYGLSSSVYSTDVERAQAVGARLETGMVWVNSTSKSSAELPFGGVKRSGFGRELGQLGIEEFANRKLIRIP